MVLISQETKADLLRKSLVELKVNQTLEQPLTASDVAQKHGWKTDPTERLLRASTCVQILKSVGKNSFQWNAHSRSVPATNTPSEVLDYERTFINPFLGAKALTHSLSTGRSAWPVVFGGDVTNPFVLYKKYPEKMTMFSNRMRTLNELANRQVAPELPLDGVATVLDVAGGQGSLGVAILERRPEIQAIHILELPDAIENFKKGSSAPLNPKIEYRPGNILKSSAFGGFEGLSSEARYDLVTLSWVLHDWDDASAIEILKRARQHLKPGGHAVVIELVKEAEEITRADWLNLIMLLHTEGGRERSLSEFKNIALAAGFKDVRRVTHFGNQREVLILE